MGISQHYTCWVTLQFSAIFFSNFFFCIILFICSSFCVHYRNILNSQVSLCDSKVEYLLFWYCIVVDVTITSWLIVRLKLVLVLRDK